MTNRRIKCQSRIFFNPVWYPILAKLNLAWSAAKDPKFSLAKLNLAWSADSLSAQVDLNLDRRTQTVCADLNVDFKINTSKFMCTAKFANVRILNLVTNAQATS